MFEKIKNIYNKIISLIMTKKNNYKLDSVYFEEKLSKEENEFYSFDEKEANKILEEIQKEVPNSSIGMEDIKRNYNGLKSIYDQEKIKWLKGNENIPIEKLIQIINTLSKEDMEYIRHNKFANNRMTIQAISDMGLKKFFELKSNGNLDEIFHIKNFEKNTDLFKMTNEEKKYFLDIAHYNQKIGKNFYMYYYAVKNYDKDKLDLIQKFHFDTINYFNKRTRDDKSGYKWANETVVLPSGFELLLIRNLDTKKILEIREKTNVSLNVIFTAMVCLETKIGEIEDDIFEKLIKNYDKFNLNVLTDQLKRTNKDQMISMLLSLPDDLDTDYEQVLKECLLGKFRRFNISTYEELINYENICNEKILQEFEINDDTEQLKEMILQTKVKDIDGLKRDLYFYNKYIGEKSQEDEIYSKFNKLINAKDKKELLESYTYLNSINSKFELDELLTDIRNKLNEIAKDDITQKMKEMKEKINDSNYKKIDGENVIDLTGTNFNLLISVIGAQGSPYLVNYYNSIIDTKFNDNIKKKLIKYGIKRLINKRYKLDPLKNKQRCTSSIDEDYLGHVRSYKIIDDKRKVDNKLILAYFPEEKEHVYWMGTEDLMTIYDKQRNDQTRKRVPHRDNLNGVCNLKLKDLNSSTMGDLNEVIVDSYPGAVICFDKVSDISKKTAKKLNIPILYINSKEQTKVMKENLEKYYNSVYKKISKDKTIRDDIFNEIFNVYEKDNNIIHRAFKFAGSFSYLNDEDFPKEEVIEVFDKMKALVSESLKRSNPTQKKIIQEIMHKEANSDYLRYGKYNEFIDFEELQNMVTDEKKEEIKIDCK